MLAFLIGMLATTYLCWALHRSSINFFDSQWPRPWPYPDNWLWVWEHDMDIASPASPGFMKLDGEWQRQCICLYGLIGLSLIIAFSGFIWLTKFRADRRIWFGIALIFFATSWFVPIMAKDSLFDLFRFHMLESAFLPVIFNRAVVSVVLAWVIQYLIAILWTKTRGRKQEKILREERLHV
jgi:hypothetical protein